MPRNINHMNSKLFSQFTDQKLTINGSWQGDEHQLQFIGNISSSAPFVMISLMMCGDAFHYMKHRKSDALDVSLTLHQGKFPYQNRYQHSLMIGASVNIGAVSEGCLCLADALPMTLPTGELFALATDSQNEPFIHLLAIAKADIKSKRCGIWTVKPRLLEGVDEPWLNVLTKTRHGSIHFR